MKQQEIEFFWPLTEQIPLDLDYTECYYKSPVYWNNVNSIGAISGSTTDSLAPVTTGFQIRPTPVSAGYWGIGGDSMQIHREKKPNWLHRTFSKILIGWEWKDK
jgi:hypothetical protein